MTTCDDRDCDTRVAVTVRIRILLVNISLLVCHYLTCYALLFTRGVEYAGGRGGRAIWHLRLNTDENPTYGKFHVNLNTVSVNCCIDNN